MVFDLQTGECLHVLPGHSATVVAAVITRKNRCIFSVLCSTSLHSAELVEPYAFSQAFSQAMRHGNTRACATHG